MGWTRGHTCRVKMGLTGGGRLAAFGEWRAMGHKEETGAGGGTARNSRYNKE